MNDELINNMLDKSEEAFLMAIEIYNKPTIKYRLEGFAFSICNAWELLLKAKMLNEGKSIYYPDKPNRTISLSNCVSSVFTNDKDPIRKNLEILIGLRNTTTHYVIKEMDTIYLPFMQSNVLNYSQRAHGESEGKYSTMGFLEKEDLKNWIDYILLLNKNAKIILYGWSMGAATILSYLGKYKNEHIICAITDAGYSSLKEEFLYVAKKTIKLPTRYSLNALDFVMKIRCGFSLKDVNIAANLENNFTPILFIHGEDDTFVPFYMQKILYENDAGEKEKISFPKSEHVQSLTNYPQEYMEKVKNFINKYSCN